MVILVYPILSVYPIHNSCQMEKKAFFTIPLKRRPSPHLFERKAREHNLLVCGIDEAGRGPLAGPVVAAAVILKPGKKHPLLQDSKQLSPEDREIAYSWLMHHSWAGIGIASHSLIERLNIYQATLYAMERAYYQLTITHQRIPACILVDAMPLKLNSTPQELPTTILDPYSDDPLEFPWNKIIYFPHSEERSRSIAAASIVAKVTRDRMMATAAHTFPGYGLEQHKGYATPAHYAAWRAQGACLIHRPSFLHKESG